MSPELLLKISQDHQRELRGFAGHASRRTR